MVKYLLYNSFAVGDLNLSNDYESISQLFHQRFIQGRKKPWNSSILSKLLLNNKVCCYHFLCLVF